MCIYHISYLLQAIIKHFGQFIVVFGHKLNKSLYYFSRILFGMVTKLCAMWSGIWISFSKSSRQSLRTTQLHIQWAPAGKADGAWKLVTHFHLVLNLRMSGAVPLFSYYAFMLGAGRRLNFRSFTLPVTLFCTVESCKSREFLII